MTTSSPCCQGNACSASSASPLVGEATGSASSTQPKEAQIQLKPGQVVHADSVADYHAALEAAGDRLVVVDCFAPWCPPCREIAPVFEGLASDYPDTVFIKVNVDKAPSLSKELSVWALPTFVFLKYGKTVGSFMGANQNLLRRGLENEGQVSMCSNLSCHIQ